MGLRSSLSKAFDNGWTAFNQEMAIGYAEHKATQQVQRAVQRSRYVDTLITGDYTPMKASRVTAS